MKEKHKKSNNFLKEIQFSKVRKSFSKKKVKTNLNKEEKRKSLQQEQ